MSFFLSDHFLVLRLGNIDDLSGWVDVERHVLLDGWQRTS